MTKILWWNVERCGEGTSDADKKAIDDAIAAVKPDIWILGEVLANSTKFQAINYTYRKESPKQLCYALGGPASAGVAVAKAAVAPSPAAIADYVLAGFKKGTTFTELTDRAPGHMHLGAAHGNVDLYFWHAPAGEAAAEKAVGLLLCTLNDFHGVNPWLLVGDINVRPERLGAQGFGIEVADLVIASGLPTKGLKEYDYAFGNFKAKVTRLRRTMRWSDHMPIVVEY